MTAPVEVRTPDGKTNGSVELPAEIFDAQANIALMHQVVVAQLAAARQGTHAAKTRGQVSGGGAKPYRQKGTGRARQGSTRAPQFAGGGVVHGPQPRKYDQRTPKKMKAAALRGALSDRARDGRVHVLTHVVGGEVPSTKDAIAALAAVSSAERLLVVLEPADVVGWKSLRNVPRVHLIDSGQLNTYDVLVNDDVVFTQAALESFLAGGKKQLPDVSTHESAGGVPSVAPAAGEGTVETTNAPEKAAAKQAAPASTEDQPYGAGSRAALEDGSQPDGFPIKGNASSKLYHVPGSSHYERTAAEVWFATTEDAEAAGFQLPKSQRPAADEEGEK